MTTGFSINSIIIGADAVVFLMMIPILFALIRERRIRRFESKVLFHLIVVQAILTVCDALSFILLAGTKDPAAWEFLQTVAYTLSMVVLFLFILYQVYTFRQKTYVSEGVIYFAAFLCGAAALIWIIGMAQPKSWFMGVDSDGNIYATDADWITYVLPGIAILFSTFLSLSCRKTMTRAELISWVSYLILPLIAGFVDAFAHISFVFCAVGLSIMMLYTNIYVANIRTMTLNETELSKSSMRLMVSQIQPHFMYNSLNSIHYLIGKDPELAQEAVSTFSDYLRQNINSIKTDKPVRFEEEIGHTETYVYLEKLRFGDELNVVFDIRAKDFLIPPLTVQPLVENAIKHGITRREGGGTVRILSLEKASCYEIVVADNGVGFKAGQFRDDDASTHIGIFSVHNRLKLMCGGKLSVESVPGEGTICTITIPKENQIEE